MVYKEFRLHRHDRYHAVTQLHAKTHLGGGDTSAFAMPSAAIAVALSSTFVASGFFLSSKGM